MLAATQDTTKPVDYIDAKLSVLSSGVTYTDEFVAWYGTRRDLQERRRAYGSGDQVAVAHNWRVPPEVILPDGTVVAVNYTPRSKWSLDWRDGSALLASGSLTVPVTFSERPGFYGLKLSSGVPVENVLTLYGTGTLAVFTPGHCYYFNDGMNCKFCSLGPTRAAGREHLTTIPPHVAREAVEVALKTDGHRVRHIVLNGGNVPDYDAGFVKHLRILEAVRGLSLPASIGLRLISMPPRDARLFSELGALRSTLAMSLEVFNPAIFARVCPGKARDYGRARFLAAFGDAAVALGAGNVYSGFVAGLEPHDDLAEGLRSLSALGVVPAVNVFHPDAGSEMSNAARPDHRFLNEVLRTMVGIYARHGFEPFISGSGRNSLDTEAYREARKQQPSAGGADADHL